MNASRTIEQHRLVPKLENNAALFLFDITPGHLQPQLAWWAADHGRSSQRSLARGSLISAIIGPVSRRYRRDERGNSRREKGDFNMKSEEIHNALQFAGGAN